MKIKNPDFELSPLVSLLFRSMDSSQPMLCIWTTTKMAQQQICPLRISVVLISNETKFRLFAFYRKMKEQPHPVFTKVVHWVERKCPQNGKCYSLRFWFLIELTNKKAKTGCDRNLSMHKTTIINAVKCFHKITVFIFATDINYLQDEK